MLKISTILTVYQMASDAIKELKQAQRQPASEHQSLIEALVDVRDISARLGGQLAWQQALKSPSAPEPASEPAPAPAPERISQLKLRDYVKASASAPAHQRLAHLADPAPTLDLWLKATGLALESRIQGEPGTHAIGGVAKAFMAYAKRHNIKIGETFTLNKSDICKISGYSTTTVRKVSEWLRAKGLMGTHPATQQGKRWRWRCSLTMPAPGGGSSSLARPEWLAAALKSLAVRKTGEADPKALKGVIRACARLAKWQGDALIIKAPASAFAKEADTTASTALRCIYWMRAKGLATTKQAPTKQKPIEMTLTMPGGAQ